MNTAKPILASREYCTGCGACMNICPQNAIKMIPDHEGFIQPIINQNLCVRCKKCQKSCPVLNPRYNNDKVDSCYAMWGNDDLRGETSTAGMFRLIALKTLKNGGVVYGAVWDKSWNVHHIAVEKEKDLPLITGSKYVQSDVGFTYREAQEELNKGRKVLYSGCPCQIAGLYSYLGSKSYPDLTTIDLICHGTPSPKVFNKFLKDNFGDKKISEIFFRDKSVHGWSSTTTIHFEDSTTYRRDQYNDPFLKAYLSCLISRRSCEKCPFSKLPRQGNLTLGDFWGIDRVDKTWNDKKGTELVLINNRQGQNICDELKPYFQRWKKFPLEAAIKGNKPIIAPFKSHAGRKHFFTSMDLKPFNRLVEDALNHNYDIGIVGLWYGINYGSILTYFALYCLLRELGYDPVMLPKPNNLWNEKFNQMDTIGQKFIWKHCNVFLPYKSQAEYIHANDRCKDFILGSDVVWNYDICGKETDQFFFLDWVESGHKKIAYAASFGNRLEGDLSYREKAKYYLKKFDAISVREESGVLQLIEECGQTDVELVLDPVFMCDPQIYIDVTKGCYIAGEKPFIFAYLLNVNLSAFKMQIMDHMRELFSMKLKICGNPNALNKIIDCYGPEVMPEISVEEWLYYIMNCSYFIGDSYHGLCFSLIFHKPFLIIYNADASKNSRQRFESLLKLVGLEERILFSSVSMEEALSLIRKEIDWVKVDEILRLNKEKSLMWLKSALAKEYPKPTSEDYVYDSYKRKYYDQQIRIEDQEKTIKDLKFKVSDLSTKLDNNKMGSLKRIKRKLIGGIRCCKEHGIPYTIHYSISKFLNN